MNFYKNKLGTKNYLKILRKSPKKLSKEFLMKNWGIFSGDKLFFRALKLFELLSSIKKIKGDIVEFGIWNGNNLFTLKKLSDYISPQKKIIGYDHFKGLQNPDKKDSFFYKKDLGTYSGDKKLIKFVIKFFKFNNIKIIDNDIMNLDKEMKHFKKLSFVYIDCDLYLPTLKILELLSKKMSKGGIFAFDEGNKKKWIGEGKALNDFFKKNKRHYKKIYLKKNYQPDVILKKV